jgi:Uma2 family endonuclease
MSRLQKNIRISVEEFLEGEKYSETRHEYVNGMVYDMVGASKTHNLIAVNLVSMLRNHLRGTACRAFMSDMKVRVGDAFYYPDVVVTCDIEREPEYYCEQPLLVVEVLSSATRQRDELDKRVAYQTLKSLSEYVLVEQDRMEVRIYRRSHEGWDLQTYTADDYSVPFDSVKITFPLKTLYEEVW